MHIQLLLQEIALLKQQYDNLAMRNKLQSLTKRARTHLTYHSNALERGICSPNNKHH